MNALVKDPILWTDVGAVTDVPVRGARRVVDARINSKLDPRMAFALD